MSGTVFAELANRESENRPCFATDATSAGYTATYAAVPSGSEEFLEPEPCLSRFRVRSRSLPVGKDFWCLLYHAENEVVCVSEFEVPDPDLDDFGDPAATETPATDLGQIFVPWSDALSFSAHEAEPPRGTVTVSYQREVIFSQQVEVEIERLPRWQPSVAIDRRLLEASDE